MASDFDVDQLRLQMEALIRDNPDMEDDERLRVDMFEGATDMGEVLERLVGAYAADRDMVMTLTSRINRMTDRRARFVRRIEHLRALMLSVMQSGNLKKLTLPEATLSQRRGQPGIVGEPDVNLLPAEFVRVKTEADRIAIREALLAGRQLPGLSLSNAPPALQITVK
jgi:hypothetical protein